MPPHETFTHAPSDDNLPTSPAAEGPSGIRNGTPRFTSPCTSSYARESFVKIEQVWHVKASNYVKERWGWLVTFATFVILLLIYGFLNCYSLLFVAFRTEFNSSATATGWIGSLTTGVAHFAGPLTNFLVQKLHSPRHVVFIGIVLCFVGLMASSFVTSIYFLFGTIGIFYGVGMNMTFQASFVLIVQHFPDKNCSRAVSIAYSGCSIGMLILSPIINYGLEIIGWRATLRYIGGVILVIGSLCSLPMFPVAHKTKNMQRQFTRLQEAATQETSKATESTSITSKSENAGTSTSNDSLDNNRVLERLSTTKQQKRILHRGRLWVLFVCMFMTSTAQIFYNINYVDYLKVIGITSDQSAIMITLYAAGQIAGELSLSLFADRLPCQKVYILALSSLLCGVTTIPIMFVSTDPALKAISIVLGIIRAPRTVLVIPTAIEICGVSHVQQVTSAVMVAHGVGFICGSLVMGVTFDQTGSYDLSISICIALLTLSCVLYTSVPLRTKYKRTIITTKDCIKSLNKTEEHLTSDDEGCHIVPIPNLVAPVGDIVPMLVASQESLNDIEHVEVHPDIEDQWIDYGIQYSMDLSESQSSLHGFQSPGGSFGSRDLSHPINVEVPLSEELILRLKPQDELIKPIENCNSSAKLLNNEELVQSSSLGTESESDSAKLEPVDLTYTSPEVPLSDEDGLVMWLGTRGKVKYTSKYTINKIVQQGSTKNRLVDHEIILQNLSSLGTETNLRDDSEPDDLSHVSSESNENSENNEVEKIYDFGNEQCNDLLSVSTDMSEDHRYGDVNMIENHFSVNENDEASLYGRSESGSENLVLATGFANPMSEAFEDFISLHSSVDSSTACTVSNVLVYDNGTQTVIEQSNVQNHVDEKNLGFIH